MDVRCTSSHPVPPEALRDLRQLYDELDEHLARLGAVCRACGDCCDFARHDYRLYGSHLERSLVEAFHGEPRLTPSGTCGFRVDGRCSIHGERVLGCRVFFCDPAYKPHEQRVCHAFQRRLRALAERYGLPWDYRPLFTNS